MASSKQSSSCLVRCAAMTPYSFIAAYEKARFHGLRWCICFIGSRWATTDGGRLSQSNSRKWVIDNGQDSKHIHEPLGKPSLPSMVGMREESRIDSAFGP